MASETLPSFYQEYSLDDKYKHGVPFGQELLINLDDIKQRVKNRKASLIIVDGGVGEGKTTLAAHCADYLGETPINMQEQIGLGGEDFTKKLRNAAKKKLKVIIYDEAGDFNRKGAITRFNMMMNRVFETYRTFQVIVIAVLPSFYYLDNQLFDNKIPRLLLHCKGRRESYGNFSGYSLYRLMYLRDRMKKMVVKEHAFSVVQPNFNGHFLDLPKKRSKELDAISTSSKMTVLENTQKKLSNLYTFKDIVEKTGRSVPWLRKFFFEKKVKPDRKIGYTNFYNKKAIDFVMKHLQQSKKTYYK